MGNEIWAPFSWSRVRIQQWVLKIRILWPTLLDFPIYCPNSYLNNFIFSGSSDVMVLTAVAAACHLLQHLDPHSALGPASRLLPTFHSLTCRLLLSSVLCLNPMLFMFILIL